MHAVRLPPILPLVAGLILGACESRTPVHPPTAEEASDFTLTGPVLSEEDMVSQTITTLPPPSGADGPAASDIADEPIVRPLQQVSETHSNGYWRGTNYELLARHSYVGNVGAISSMVHITRGDRPFLSRPSRRQEYTPFVVDFGRKKRIFHTTRVDLDQSCGFVGHGSSQHMAWWQFYQGRSAPEWGMSEAPSYASPAPGPCDQGTGERTGTVTEDGGRVCTVLITYDLDTNEILHMEVLSCYTASDSRL